VRRAVGALAALALSVGIANAQPYQSVPLLSSPPPLGNVVPNTGAFTTLSATGTSTFGGTNPVLQAASGALVLRGAGTSGINLGSATSGNVLQLTPNVTNGDTLQILQPAAAGTPVRFGMTNAASGGFNFVNQVQINRSWTYAGTSAAILNQPFIINETIGGTSANTAQFLVNSVTMNYNGFHSSQGTYGFSIRGLVGAGTNMRTNVPLAVTANQNGQPAKITDIAWQANHAYSTVGEVAANGPGLYQVQVAGTSGNAGGPTGTGGTIVDGGVTWSWEDVSANANYQVAFGPLATANYNLGGVSGAPVGSNFGMTLGCGLQTGATFYTQNVCVELDDFITAGASANRDATMQLVKSGGQGIVQDWGISLAGVSGHSWRNPLIFQTAIDPNGIGISVYDQSVGGLQTMAGFIDCLMCSTTGSNTTSGALVSGGGGFVLRSANSQWLGNGDQQIGSALFHISANTLTIDTGYQVLSAIGATSGGTGWLTGGEARDAFGNVGIVTAVAGVPSSVDIAGRPKVYVPTASVPGGAVTWYPATPNAVTTGATGSASIPTTFTTASETYTAGTTLNFGTAAATVIGIGNASSTTTIAGGVKLTNIPTSCAGKPTNTLAYVTAVFTLCP